LLILFLVIYLLAGLIWGSFLGVIIERLIWKKDGWHLDLFSPSHCLNCGHKLNPSDLVPIVSFLGLKGKCRYCQKPIGWKILLVEIFTGLVFVLSYLAFNFNWSFILAVVLGSILLIIFFYDSEHQLIPDPLILILFLLFIVKFIFNLAPHFYSSLNFWQPIIGGLIAAGFFLLVYLVTRGRGMGLGDVKLGLVLGLFLGIKLSIFMLWLAFFVGAILAAIMLISKLKKRTDKIAFAPFLVIGFLAIYFLPSVVNFVSTMW
jgi:leader peptidase (prepilin peptidase)/N-methyltransferase